jgi:MHS family metabolite:H+ symporter-like MFS transporter
MEYADFALYGLAAGIIFGDVFFRRLPCHGASLQLCRLFRWFYCAPIGALLFGWIGDRHGRKIVMVITIGLMGFSTMLIGLIPSYAQIGVWAPVCLVILRFSQGLGPEQNSQAAP